MNLHKIESKDLNLWYGNQFHALKGINSEFSPNSIHALIGPSGCGKSTFLRCINRLNEEIEGTKITGSIYLDGEDIYGNNVDPVQIRKKVGMVFQQPNPFPAMSIFENVIAGVKLNGLAPKREFEEIVETSLRKASLWEEVKDILHRPGSSLSGGQQQRLCIARAIAPGPDILLMDEPTSALDPIATEKIEQLVAQLGGEYTVVIVTHNMQQAKRISDKTYFFVLGEVLEQNNTKTFFTSPTHPKACEYIEGQFG